MSMGRQIRLSTAVNSFVTFDTSGRYKPNEDNEIKRKYGNPEKVCWSLEELHGYSTLQIQTSMVYV